MWDQTGEMSEYYPWLLDLSISPKADSTNIFRELSPSRLAASMSIKFQLLLSIKCNFPCFLNQLNSPIPNVDDVENGQWGYCRKSHREIILDCEKGGVTKNSLINDLIIGAGPPHWPCHNESINQLLHSVCVFTRSWKSTGSFFNLHRSDELIMLLMSALKTVYWLVTILLWFMWFRCPCIFMYLV